MASGGGGGPPAASGRSHPRRARGLPFWFSLAVHGTRAYTEAIEHTLAVTRAGQALVANATHLELVMPATLSVLAFRRVGWTQDDYDRWSRKFMDDGTGLVLPTTVDGTPALRVCVVNPRTTVDDLALVVDRLA